MPEQLVHPDAIRARFAAAMSGMYRAEVPQYGALLELVAQVNAATLARDPMGADHYRRTGEIDRLASERHGAIRLGTPGELAVIARAFAVMGMEPVGYYDLAPAGLPVHSTAFRPIDSGSLRRSPFRVFTSLLRPELIADADLRAEAMAILARRSIVTPRALQLIAKAEDAGGLTAPQAEHFVAELLETFRWHAEATVSAADYRRLLAAHRLVADIVSFAGPHINHLTPRTLDIDAAHALMPAHGMKPKESIEGPPSRRCPVLLRQTSFMALEEPVAFPQDGALVAGSHIARFGEIEQRGAALTPQGRSRYDAWLEADDGAAIPGLPDDWTQLRILGLCYFRYRATDQGKAVADGGGRLPNDPEALVATGHATADPISYDDFLPVSAAGIFRSNLAGETHAGYSVTDGRTSFAEALGRDALDPFALYDQAQAASIAEMRIRLRISAA